MFEKQIIRVVEKALGKKTDIKLEIPPDPKMGDYAFPCFTLAKTLNKNPSQIAKDIAGKIQTNKYISEVKVIGPYVNFFVKKSVLSENVLKDVYSKKDKYGSAKKKDYTVMIESPGPNTNKPLHLGHVRNMLLGNALINLYKKIGYKTVRVDILNNRGVHISKSMLAYKNFGKGKNPDKKSDHYVGDFYVKYAKELPKHPEFEQEIRDMLKKWEENDPATRKLWDKMNKWALDGIFETYKRYGVDMEKPYAESDHYAKGRTVALQGLKKKVFEKDEAGNVIVDLEKYKLGKKVILRADGTSVYMTQDLILANLRKSDYKVHKMIYIVGYPQIYHFQVLFKIFELLKYPFAKDCYHLPYGMINLPEGKMKSREGKVVDADNLAEDMKFSAAKEIKKIYKKISKKELDNRAEAIGMAAIKFFILKYDSLKDFVFNPKDSLSFEGETGPYVQYTHARISSVLRKYTKKVTDNVNYSMLDNEEEKAIIKVLQNFPEVIEKAAEEYKPNFVTRYLLDLSQAFNEYYHKHQILQDDKELEKARILLVSCVKQVLKIGLELLGIEAPKIM